MNDGPEFHLNMPISELAEHDTRAIEASDLSSTPPFAETADGAQGLELPDPNLGIRQTVV